MSREVLSPPLMRIGPNRNYRVNIVHQDFGGNMMQEQNKNKQTSAGYVEQDLYTEEDDDDVDNCLIEELGSIFKLTTHVAQSFYGGIIGFKGASKRRIENETKTEMYIPRNHIGAVQKDENIVIKGKTRSSVCAAHRQIRLVINSLRKRMRPTHFVGVPLNSGDIRTNFLKFKKSVLETVSGIDEELFQLDSRLHVTLTVCVLLDDVERAKAAELLQSSREFLTDVSTPFEVKVGGLEIMNDDPSAVQVLYARVMSPDLQTFGDRLLSLFLDSGYSKEEFGRRNVKLHVTLLNTGFILRKTLNVPKDQKFDAREILKQYGDFDFGTTKINEVHLCIRRDGDLIGYYKISHNLKL